MEQRFDNIISSFTLSSREKVFNLYNSIVNAYSRDTIRLVTIVENEMQNLKPVQNYEGAITLLHEINKRNNELNCMPKTPLPGAPIDAPIETNRMSDEALKKLLVRKLGASSAFNGLMDNLDNHPDWSWNKVQECIRDTHMRITSSDNVSSGKVIEKDEFQSYNSSTAVMAVYDEQSTKLVGRRPAKPCWNCKIEGHGVGECLAMFCRNCKTFWSSNTDKGYHNAAKCSKRPESTFQKRKNEDQSKDNGKKKKVNAVTFAKGPATDVSLWEQVCRDEAVTVVTDADDEVEELLNSVHDVYLSASSTQFLINGVSTLATQPNLTESSILMLDSGAAISITHPEVARQCGVPIIKLTQLR